MKACEIDNKVASLLQISQEVLEIEDANCTGTEFSYQMRWIRTSLKHQGLISNRKRGFWIMKK